jgi:hypothetical protein
LTIYGLITKLKIKVEPKYFFCRVKGYRMHMKALLINRLRSVQRLLGRAASGAAQSTKSNNLFEHSVALNSSALESNLKLSVEERIEAHENARQLMIDLREAGREWYGKSQIPS